MPKSRYHVPSSTLYRRVFDEVVVVQTDRGLFYYFSPGAESFLDFFRSPRSLASYLDAASLPGQPGEKEYLDGFCRFLLENEILHETEDQESIPEKVLSYDRPIFLRHGEKTLDEIALTSL